MKENRYNKDKANWYEHLVIFINQNGIIKFFISINKWSNQGKNNKLEIADNRSMDSQQNWDMSR